MVIIFFSHKGRSAKEKRASLAQSVLAYQEPSTGSLWRLPELTSITAEIISAQKCCTIDYDYIKSWISKKYNPTSSSMFLQSTQSCGLHNYLEIEAILKASLKEQAHSILQLSRLTITSFPHRQELALCFLLRCHVSVIPVLYVSGSLSFYWKGPYNPPQRYPWAPCKISV